MRIKRAHFQDRLGPPSPPQVIEREVPVADPEQRAILATIQGLLRQIASSPPPVMPSIPAFNDGEILTRLAVLERKVDAMVNRPGMAYSFSIERNAEGKIISVTAQPKPPRPALYRS